MMTILIYSGALLFGAVWCYLGFLAIKAMRIFSQVKGKSMASTHPEMEFQAGSVVRLKCGGVPMVVSGLFFNGESFFNICNWHDDGGGPCEEHYPSVVLEACSAPIDR